MIVKYHLLIICAILLGATSPVLASSLDECLMKKLKQADPDTPVWTLREECRKEAAKEATTSPAELPAAARRIKLERQAQSREFTITPHRPNYILPVTYNNTPNNKPFEAIGEEGVVDEVEALLQVSIKVPIAQNVSDNNADVFFAYTNRAWWQAYNDDFSKPFRETNYEIEVFYRHYGGSTFLGLDMAGWDFGYNHQSNGRSQLLSRSWDRIYGQVAFNVGDNSLLSLRGWYRIPEDDEDDEMPDEQRYLGYGDARFIYAADKSTYSIMWRPGTEKHSVEMTWSYPINDQFRFYTYFFNGYGESLLDNDEKSERIGIGIALNDYLHGLVK